MGGKVGEVRLNYVKDCGRSMEISEGEVRGNEVSESRGSEEK